MTRHLFGTVAFCLPVAVFGAALPGAEPWSTYQGNAAHSGYVPVSLEPGDISFRWDRTFGSGHALNPVTAADGKIFVSKRLYFNDVDSLYALDEVTGGTLWSKNFGSVFSVNPPSYAYGNVYVQTGNHGSDTYLRAYNADTGGFVFRTPHSAQWERYYAPTIYDGKVYVDGGYYGGMYSFDAFSGGQDWFHGLPQYDDWTPAVDGDYAYAYVGEYSPGLYVLDRITGNQEFMIPDPNFDWNGWSMDLAPLIGAMDDVLAIHDGRLISFDLVNRDIRWELDRSFTGQPSLAGGVIYAIDGGALVARSELTGSQLWGWEVPSDSLTGTIIVTDTHVFTRTSSSVYMVDIATHQDVWSYPVSGHLTLSDYALYIAGDNGILTAISLPEPTCLSLLALGGLLVTRRRR
ncbi:MAG: PQQ-like beta-propeller repeat protein [Planctomycetes bacterium]|nr:PQQ-like beta-propeller repeat protein [Planctomycetota bacterium]